MIITAAPPRRPNRNRRALAALSVWLGIATLVFVWAGLQNNAYRGQFKAYSADIRSALDAAPAQVKKAKDAGDASATAAVLTSLSATLSQKIDQAPTVANVLGLQIGVDAEARKQAAIVTAAKDASQALKQTADFIDFQSKLARSLQALSLKDASNYEQIVALANAWKESANALQHMARPAQLTDETAALLQKMVVAESRIRELAELYKQGDTPGFAAKQKELATIIDEIKPLGLKVAEISMSLDAQLQRTLGSLRQNL